MNHFFEIEEEILLRKSFLQRIKDTPKALKYNRILILVVILWSVLIIGLLIMEYTNYLNNSLFSYNQARGIISPPFETWQGVGITSMDLVVLFLASLVFGVLLPDIQSVLIGYFATMIVSIALASAYIANFIWSGLGWGQYLALVNSGWSWAYYWGLLIILRAIFPIGVALALLGVLVGAFGKAYVNYG